MSAVPYTLALHHHRFAGWAAARASQRGQSASTRSIMDALERCGIVALVDAEADWPSTATAFDGAHKEWRRSFLRALGSRGVAGATHGRAAKCIAIYLKSRIVLGGHHASAFADVIHPPIDRVLLRGLAAHLRARDPRSQFAKVLRDTAWTSSGESDYDALIAGLRHTGLDRAAFWHLERFWDPRGEET